jgi:hypothetical protein
MESKKRFSTSIVWYHREDQTPSNGNRILVFSPNYNEKDPFRIRLIDSQFFKISKDVEWWAYVNLPT